MLIVEGHKILNYSEHMNEDEFYEFCQMNKELRIERDSEKNIIIMAPVGGESGFFEKEFIGNIWFWEQKNPFGKSFSSSTGFRLPNGAMRSPDSSWVNKERWETVADHQKKKFLPVVPNFIVEVRSDTDSLKKLQTKMQEWIDNGVELGWLVDPPNQQVFIYRINKEVEIMEGFNRKLSGENVMPGFEFDLSRLKMS